MPLFEEKNKNFDIELYFNYQALDLELAQADSGPEVPPVHLALPLVHQPLEPAASILEQPVLGVQLLVQILLELLVNLEEPQLPVLRYNSSFCWL